MFSLDVAIAARQHNGLVVTATLAVEVFFKGAEVAANIRATKFVVKRRTTEWAVNHDIQRSHNAAWLTIIHFPRLFKAGDLQVGYSETIQTHFGFGAAAYRTFIANLTAGASTGARERRNRRGVIVSLHLH